MSGCRNCGAAIAGIHAQYVTFDCGSRLFASLQFDESRGCLHRQIETLTCERDEAKQDVERLREENSQLREQVKKRAAWTPDMCYLEQVESDKGGER